MFQLNDHIEDCSSRSERHFPFGDAAYVKIGSVIGIGMRDMFCDFVNEWLDGDRFKRMLFDMRKEKDLVERGCSLMILAVLGELTIQLCQMLVEGICDDPYIQNNISQSIKYIRCVKDEKDVFNLLFSYFKSKSMSVRYITVRIVLHLCQLSLIGFEEVVRVLNDVMIDSSSNEDLWLIKEQDNFSFECQYENVGPLKDVIYSLIVQYITQQQTSIYIGTNPLNDIHLDFIESAKACRYSSCLYETKCEDIPK